MTRNDWILALAAHAPAVLRAAELLGAYVHPVAEAGPAALYDNLEAVLDGDRGALQEIVELVRGLWALTDAQDVSDEGWGLGLPEADIAAHEALERLADSIPDLDAVEVPVKIRDLAYSEILAVARVRDLLPPGAVIAGGYVRDLLRGAEPRDVDAFTVAAPIRRDLPALQATLDRSDPPTGPWGRLFRVDLDGQTAAWHRDAAWVIHDRMTARRRSAVARAAGLAETPSPGSLVAGHLRTALPIDTIEVTPSTPGAQDPQEPGGLPPAIRDRIDAFDAPINQVWIHPTRPEIWALTAGERTSALPDYTYNVGSAYGPVRWLARALKYAARGFVVDEASTRLVAWYAARKLGAGVPVSWLVGGPGGATAALSSGPEESAAADGCPELSEDGGW